MTGVDTKPAGAGVGKISITTATGTATSATNFEVTTIVPARYRVYVPLFKAGQPTTTNDAGLLYNWRASSPFGYCTLQ